MFDISMPEQNGRRFADDISKWIFYIEVCVLGPFLSLLNFISEYTIDNFSSLVLDNGLEPQLVEAACVAYENKTIKALLTVEAKRMRH